MNRAMLVNSKREGRIGIRGVPYSPYFVQRIKGLGLNHAWDSRTKTWFFDESGRDRVLCLVAKTWEKRDDPLQVVDINGAALMEVGEEHKVDHPVWREMSFNEFANAFKNGVYGGDINETALHLH
jgi:hypothetical protein